MYKLKTLRLCSLFICLALVACGAASPTVPAPNPGQSAPLPANPTDQATQVTGGTGSLTTQVSDTASSQTTASLTTQATTVAGPQTTQTTAAATTQTSQVQLNTTPALTSQAPAATSQPATSNLQTTAPTATPVARGRFFDHIVIIVLENTDYAAALNQPYFKQLGDKGALLKQYYAVAHPSYPNYLALAGGSTFGVTDDGQRNLDYTNLSDLLESAGISWKVYAESLPATSCFKGTASGSYARKHEPFISFLNVQNNPARCEHIVPAAQLQADVSANKLPQYVLYVPDMNDDGHDTGANFAAKWLQGFLEPFLQNPNFSKGTAVVVTFDEGKDGGTNQVFTAVVGEPVKAGSSSDTRYNHYDLLRTIEENFGLGTLGREDARAKPITGIWK